MRISPILFDGVYGAEGILLHPCPWNENEIVLGCRDRIVAESGRYGFALSASFPGEVSM